MVRKYEGMQTEPFGFKWPDEPVLALGVYFSYNQVECNKLNFEEKLKEP